MSVIQTELPGKSLPALFALFLGDVPRAAVGQDDHLVMADRVPPASEQVFDGGAQGASPAEKEVTIRLVWARETRQGGHGCFLLGRWRIDWLGQMLFLGGRWVDLIGVPPPIRSTLASALNLGD
jgi:hypothetical protein